jgi:hypothetical protein
MGYVLGSKQFKLTEELEISSQTFLEMFQKLLYFYFLGYRLTYRRIVKMDE